MNKHRIQTLLGAVAFFVLLLPLASHLPAPVGWLCDFAAVPRLPMAFLALPLAGKLLLDRHRTLGVALLIAAGLTIALFTARSADLHLPSPTRDRGGEFDLRVLVINASPTLQNIVPLLDTIDTWNPDVVALVEASAPLAREARRGTILPVTYPYDAIQSPETDVNGWIIILSKLPLHSIDRSSPGLVAAVLEHPLGEAGLVAFQAPSPRTPGRWVKGNAVAATVALIASDQSAMGRAVLAMGDLNGSRGGNRERLIRAGGTLKRAKPLLRPSGTFPAVPAALAISIDDAWLGSGVRAVAWTVLPLVGSDHRPVLIDCRFTEPADK